MKTIALVAQTPEPPVSPAGVYLSPELLVIGGGGAVLSAGFALIKWFVGREFHRINQQNADVTVELKDVRTGLLERIKELEAKQSDDRLTAQTVERMSGRLEVLEDQRANLKTLEQRFENMTGAFLDMQRNFQDYQKEHMTLRAELNREYVTREDWLRYGTKIESLIEALHRRLDEMKTQQGARP
jgi:chromosome segregation ATPase